MRPLLAALALLALLGAVLVVDLVPVGKRWKERQR